MKSKLKDKVSANNHCSCPTLFSACLCVCTLLHVFLSSDKTKPRNRWTDCHYVQIWRPWKLKKLVYLSLSFLIDKKKSSKENSWYVYVFVIFLFCVCVCALCLFSFVFVLLLVLSMIFPHMQEKRKRKKKRSALLYDFHLIYSRSLSSLSIEIF